MATASVPYISVDEYLHTMYHPDVDYVEGLIEERSLGESDHGDLQLEVGMLIRLRSDDWGVRVFAETRVQVSPTRFRVPDICVMPLSWQRTPIISEPPLLCVEVLSPEDRLTRMRQRCNDYLQMGVPEVWILDPAKRTSHRLTPDTFTEQKDGILQLAATPINIDLAKLFAVLDR